MKKISVPFTRKNVNALKAGDAILLSGVIYTARDQAHKKLVDAIRRGKNIPLKLEGQIIYYCGPTPAPKSRPIGSCGPTTSGRMDDFTPILLAKGLLGMIGKGDRSREVKAAIKKYKAVYFVAIGGAGAYLSKRVERAGVVGYKELGPEAIYRLEVKDFPVVVAIDSKGRSLFNER